MKKQRLAVLLTALAMCLSMAACSESSSSDAQSDTESSSLVNSETQTESSESEKDTETTTTTSETETTTTTTTSATTSETTTTQQTTTSAQQSTSVSRTEPVPTVGTDLKKIVSGLYTVTDLSQKVAAAEDPEDVFSDTASAPGAYALFSEMKTAQLIDPFDELLSDEKRIASAKADAQVFIILNEFEYKEESTGINTETDLSADGAMFAVGFNCADENEAKELFKLVVTDDMKNQISTDNDSPKYAFGDDYAIGKNARDGDSYCFCYYRIGNNVYALAYYDFDITKEAVPVDPNYKKPLNYAAELDKLCKAIGAAKLPSAV